MKKLGLQDQIKRFYILVVSALTDCPGATSLGFAGQDSSSRGTWAGDVGMMSFFPLDEGVSRRRVRAEAFLIRNRSSNSVDLSHELNH